MRNLFILFKNNYNIFIGNFQKNKKRKSMWVASAILAIGLILILALYSYQAYMMYYGLGELGLEKVCMFHAFLTTLSVLVIIGIMRSSANAKNNDADFLLSMPIKKRDIIISKTLNKYIFDLFFVVMMFLPYLIIHQIKVGLNLPMLILGILLVFLLPLLSVGISYIFDFIISRIFNRTKIASLLKSVTITIIFIVIMVLLYMVTSTYGIVEVNNLDAYFASRPITNLFMQFIFTPNILNVLGVIGLIVLPFVLGVVLYSINYGKSFISYSAKNNNLKFGCGKSSFKMLLKKELFNYGTTTAYIINTIISPLIVIVGAVLLCYVGLEQVSSILTMFMPFEYFPGILAIAASLALSMSVISASTISLEGKNIWLLKSSPINNNELFSAKACLHIVILEPAVIIASLLLLIFFKLSLLQFLIIFLLPTLCVIITAFLGVLINLWLPLLDYDNETKVIKQSLAVTLTMLFSALLALIPLAIYLLFSTLSLINLFLISLGVYVLLLIIVLAVLYTKGKTLFKKL